MSQQASEFFWPTADCGHRFLLNQTQHMEELLGELLGLILGLVDQDSVPCCRFVCHHWNHLILTIAFADDSPLPFFLNIFVK
jgi:hypothetical protein